MGIIDRIKKLDGRLRVGAGIVCIALGLLALVTPLTPGSWLIFVGLELIGLELIAWKKIKAWLLREDAVRDNAVDTHER